MTVKGTREASSEEEEEEKGTDGGPDVAIPAKTAIVEARSDECMVEMWCGVADEDYEEKDD